MKLMARIRRAVPASISAGLRDDIIGELALACIEGTLSIDLVERQAPRFVSAGYAAWANAFKFTSLDTPIGPDDERTRGETIEDEQALAAFERVGFGWEAPA